MAYKTPTVPTIPNPIFVDAAIAEIQTQLGTVSWLTHAFGRSYIKKEMRSGNETIVPMVYKGQAEYLPVQFNDNLQAQSFFEVGTQTLNGEYDTNGINFYDVPVSLIVWANLKKIDGVKGNSYYFAEELKRDVRQALRDSTFVESRLVIDSISEDIDAIFSEYTFTQITYQFFTYPYVAFKFDMTLTIQEVCP
jgi:hypothetical protein